MNKGVDASLHLYFFSQKNLAQRSEQGLQRLDERWAESNGFGNKLKFDKS
ncbi:hypothetical protein ACWOET_08565 [Enterococcus caccae]